MAEESSELKSAHAKIIELMEKSHAMELKVKEQEIDALKVKHTTESEKSKIQLAELTTKLTMKETLIAELEAESAKQKTYIEELEVSISKLNDEKARLSNLKESAKESQPLT